MMLMLMKQLQTIKQSVIFNVGLFLLSEWPFAIFQQNFDIQFVTRGGDALNLGDT